jgi:hypothetical protein
VILHSIPHAADYYNFSKVSNFEKDKCYRNGYKAFALMAQRLYENAVILNEAIAK